MTWINTVLPSDDDEDPVARALNGQHGLYPPEYAVRVDAATQYTPGDPGGSIVMSHSLFPQTLYHAFATFGTLMAPEMPLTRRQQEMIAATVSTLNRCFY
jgi:hypothetical protein